jgi:hypothetical protein
MGVVQAVFNLHGGGRHLREGMRQRHGGALVAHPGRGVEEKNARHVCGPSSRILMGYQPQPASGQAKRTKHAALSQELTSQIEVLVEAPVAAAPPHVVALDSPVQVVGAVSGKQGVSLPRRSFKPAVRFVLAVMAPA